MSKEIALFTSLKKLDGKGIEYLMRSNTSAPIDIKGVAKLDILNDGTKRFAVIYTVCDKQYTMTINENLYNALHLIFDNIKTTHLNETTAWAMNSVTQG